MTVLSVAAFNALYAQTELALVVLRLSLELGSPVSQNSQRGYPVLLIEWQHLVIKQVGRCERMFGFIDLGKGNPAVGIDESLQADPANTLDVADMVCVLGSKVTRMLGFNFPMCFPFFLFAFQGDKLRLGEEKTFFGYPGLQEL
jgi:hypothetical protein